MQFKIIQSLSSFATARRASAIYDSDSVFGTRVYVAQLRCNMAKVLKKKSAERRVKNRSKVTKEKPEVAYDEEEGENITSEEEEEEKDDGLDERKHLKLLEAISSLGGQRCSKACLHSL